MDPKPENPRSENAGVSVVHGQWHPPAVEDITDVLARLAVPWWVAGGWALDLFLGRSTREHGDLDIEILRCDAPALRETLPNWEHFAAIEGSLRRWTGGPVPAQANSLWSRRVGTEAWELQFMLAGGDQREWRYRRDERIRMPIERVGLRSATGIPFLRPEIELLYKSNKPAPKDEADLALTVPHLTTSQREWLAGALHTTSGKHIWLDFVAPGSRQ